MSTEITYHQNYFLQLLVHFVAWNHQKSKHKVTSSTIDAVIDLLHHKKCQPLIFQGEQQKKQCLSGNTKRRSSDEAPKPTRDDEAEEGSIGAAEEVSWAIND